MTSPSETQTFCMTCDAPPGQCHHTDKRYLDDITYEQDPRDHGWTVPDHERERWRAELLRPEPPKPTVALDLSDLERLLEPILWLELPLQAELAAAYERDDQTTTLAVRAVIAASGTGKITSPAGLLRSKLRNIRAVAREELPWEGDEPPVVT
jgi:hypothetical protein